MLHSLYYLKIEFYSCTKFHDSGIFEFYDIFSKVFGLCISVSVSYVQTGTDYRLSGVLLCECRIILSEFCPYKNFLCFVC